MNKEKIRAEAGESDFVNERSADSMAENIRSLLRGIRNSVRGLIRNVAFAAQVSAAGLGVVDCSPSPDPEPDTPPQCVSAIPPSELDDLLQCIRTNPEDAVDPPQCASMIPAPPDAEDDTPQCDSASFGSPEIKKVAFCFMHWDDSYDLTEAARAEINAKFNEATQYFTEATFGRYLYQFSLVDSGAVWTGPSPGTWDDEINFAVAACASQIYFDELDTFSVFPSSYGGAYGDRRILNTPQGDVEVGVVRLPFHDNYIPGFEDLKHEIGHASFRFNHATQYYCYDDDQPVTYNPDPAKCRTQTYANRYDLMGGGLNLPGADFSESIYGDIGGFEKSLSGIVQTTDITENSGTYPLASLEEPCRNVPQLLRIPYAKVPLCLEFRKPTGLDADFSENNINDKFGFKVGLPPEGCLFLSICSNDETTFEYGPVFNNYNGANFQLLPNPLLCEMPPLQLLSRRLPDSLNVCLPPEGFCDTNLGIGVSYGQSTTNPNAVIVNVSGVDESRIAKLPNLIAGSGTYTSSIFSGKTAYIKNVSENGESVDTFDIEISGKRISDGQFELIETRTVDGLHLFENATINFPRDQLESLKLIYSELRVTADSGNAIEETDEADNEVTYGIDF